MDEKTKALVEKMLAARGTEFGVPELVEFGDDEVVEICAHLRAQAEENERLKALLKQHHDWHLQAGIIGLQDGSGGWIGIDNALEYSDSGMCERTTQALENTPPEEMVPPPRGGIGAEWWQVGILERRKRKTAEAKLHQALEWLKDSKRFVEDAGSDEDPEARRRAVWLISKIDALLTRLANPEPTKTDDPAILHQRLEERICNCAAAGQNEQHEPWCAWQDATRTDRAISALETPDSSLSRVPNTIRQSIKEVIERERSRAESAEAERDALKAELARIKSAEGCDVEAAALALYIHNAKRDRLNEKEACSAWDDEGNGYKNEMRERASAALAVGCAPLREKIKKMEAARKAFVGATVVRYEHGGGRVYRESAKGSRDLIMDLYGCDGEDPCARRELILDALSALKEPTNG